MLQLSEGRLTALTSLSGRSRVLIGALAATGALAAAPSALAGVPAYTWSGADAATSNGWNDSTNWSAAGAPGAGVTGSFVFPGSACPAGCSSSVDQSGYTAQGLTLSGDAGYYLSGSSLNLAQPTSGDALSILPDTNANPTPAAIDLPLTLTGVTDQTWAITGDGNNGYGGVNLAGVTGVNPVNVSMSAGAWLGFGGQYTISNPSPVSVGALTITGADTSKSALDGADNGKVDLEENVNANGSPVTFDGVSVEQDNTATAVTTGPLNLDSSWVDLGVGQSLTSTGAVTMDSANYVDMSLSTTSSDPAGLVAQGNVTLDGQLGLQEPYISDSSGNISICPSVTPGSTQTLIQSSGTITGTFNGDSASGGNIDVSDYCAPTAADSESNHDYWYHVSYTGSTVTATALAPTSVALTASSANLATGAAETYTATVTPNASAGNTPSGTVQFDGDAGPVECQNATAGSVPVGTDGTARCVTSYASAGTYHVWASYSGDANFAPSYSDGPATVTATAATPAPPAGPAAPANPAPPAGPAPPATPAAGTGTSTIGKPLSKPGSDTVILPIKCAAHGASCKVKVAVTARLIVVKHGKKVHKTFVLATERLTVGAGRSQRAQVRLNKAGRRLLAKHKHLATQVRVTSRRGNGAVKSSVKKVTLRAARHTSGSRKHGSKK